MNILHRVLFIRHGETEANVGEFYSGHTDTALTEVGLEQVDHAAAAIESFRPDRIYTSPLLRCKTIADKAAFALNMEAEVYEDLIELNFGAMEEKAFSSLKEHGFTFPWARDYLGRSIPCEGAESAEEAYVRAERVLEMIKGGRGKTVCVSHGGFIRCVFGRLLSVPFETIWRLRFVNVASMLVTYNDLGRYVIEGVGYTPEEVIYRSTHDSIYDVFGAFNELGEKHENRY